jgi:hypothetical protein
VSNSFKILTAIRAGQLDDATVSAALDALREDRSLQLWEAVAEVASYVAGYYADADLRRVTVRYTKSPHLRRAIRASVVRLFPTLDNAPFTIFFRPGSWSPSLHPHGYGPDDVDPTVSVGASWVTRMHDELIADNGMPDTLDEALSNVDPEDFDTRSHVSRPIPRRRRTR